MIEIMSLNKTYKAGNRALKNINITIEDGEFVFGEDAQKICAEIQEAFGGSVSGLPPFKG